MISTIYLQLDANDRNLKIKNHTRHFLLGSALAALHENNDSAILTYTNKILELQTEIEKLENQNKKLFNIFIELD